MRRRSSIVAALSVAGLIAIGAAACGTPPVKLPQRLSASDLPQLIIRQGPTATAAAAGITKIQHVVIITQENHTFDNYFGTYPGAIGFSAKKHICVPQQEEPCVKPFHTTLDISPGGPHSHAAAVADVNNGKMDGFVNEAMASQKQCTSVDAPACSLTAPKNVMSYYDQKEIPNYWAYAKHFVLDDRFFEATKSWSFPQHLYMVSGWAAKCSSLAPSSCTSNLSNYGELNNHNQTFAWTDITYLLHAAKVSWHYYVESGSEPDCVNGGDIVCDTYSQSYTKPGIWNPLPQFETVREDLQTRDVEPLDNFQTDTENGTLPSVSWVVPAQIDSEHSPARVSDGQAFVTNLVNDVMRSPEWKSTAIFINWDDWGGEYDQVAPPNVDNLGYGLRVPAMIISPYAKAGYIDSQKLSTDAYLKFIENRWLGGQALNPNTDGRPDPRPDVREDTSGLGNLLNAFDFTQKPIAPLILKPRPKTDLTEPPGYPPADKACSGSCRTQGGTN